MNVICGHELDIDSWMELVHKVRWNFPGLETQSAMDSHRSTVLRFMKEDRALCVKDGGRVVGVLLLSRKHNMICCLAVAEDHRRSGIGSVLLERALQELDRTKAVSVTTFREGDDKGEAPRALYKRFGFKEGALGEEFGYPVQEFILEETHG